MEFFGRRIVFAVLGRMERRRFFSKQLEKKMHIQIESKRLLGGNNSQFAPPRA